MVGLVPTVQMRSLRAEGNPGVYYPLSQRYSPWMALQLSSETGRSWPREAIAQTVAAIDPELPVSAVVENVFG